MRARVIALLAFAVASTAFGADDSVGPAPQVASADLLGNVAHGVAGYPTFTDGNERLHLRARVTWQAMPAYG